MFCKNCGAPIEDGAKFCESCGAEFVSDISEQSAAKTPPPEKKKKEKAASKASRPGKSKKKISLMKVFLYF